jgi:hypothetical protein
MVIYLRVLLDGYREHSSWCQFKTAEELAALADGQWEMRGSNPAFVVAVGHSASPEQQQSPACHQQQQRGYNGGGGSIGHHGRNNNGSKGATAVALAAVTAPPLPGEHYGMMAAPSPMAASTMAALWGQASCVHLTPMAPRQQDASCHASSLREMGRPVVAIVSVATGGHDG